MKDLLMKPFLILQLRPMDDAADSEFEAFLKHGDLKPMEVVRVRLEKQSIEGINPYDFAGIILGGGPSNISDVQRSKPGYQKRFEQELNVLFKTIFELDFPYLGSCYGLGAVLKFAGARISKDNYSEKVGATSINLRPEAASDPLLHEIPKSFRAFVGHKEACQELPEGATLLASSENCPIQMVRFKKNIYATQFHCELDAEGLQKRIYFYKDYDYFDPSEAMSLVKQIQQVPTDYANQILKNFIDKYRK